MKFNFSYFIIWAHSKYAFEMEFRMPFHLMAKYSVNFIGNVQKWINYFGNELICLTLLFSHRVWIHRANVSNSNSYNNAATTSQFISNRRFKINQIKIPINKWTENWTDGRLVGGLAQIWTIEVFSLDNYKFSKAQLSFSNNYFSIISEEKCLLITK